MAYLGARPTTNFRVAPTKDTFTGDGSTTTFDLANVVPAGGENALQVFVENVRQEPGSGKAYTLGADGSGDLKRITFSSAPASSAEIYVITTFSNEAFAKIEDLNGSEFVLDADGDTTITADTDDQIDIKIAGADDFKFVANTFNILSGSTLAIDSGATIANSGTATGFGGGSVVKMSVDEITAEANGSGVYSDTGLSVAITPASTDNKIMLLAIGVIGLNAMAAFRFMQGSSAINQADTPGSNTNRILSSFKCTAPNLNGSQNFVGSTIIAASATSELTFKLQVQADGGTPGNWFLNRSFNLSNSDDASHAVATSYLYAIELTGGNVSIDT